MQSRGKALISWLIGLMVVAAAYRLWWEHERKEIRLTWGEQCQDFRPSYSPDGRSIVFSRFRKVFIMDENGRNPRKIETLEGMQDAPCWSPDGKSVAFVCSEGGAYNIWISTADGKQRRNLTRDAATDSFPSWSPDGKKILFTQVSAHGSSIGCVSLDTGVVRVLNPRDKTCRCPTWSPDGRKIAFVSWKTGVRQIWVMDSDGKGPHQVVFHPGHFDDAPGWSPDGRFIVFTCEKDRHVRNLWIAPITGGEPQPLTRHVEGYDLTPSFHPSGAKVIFSRREGNQCEVRVVRVSIPSTSR